MQYSQILKLRQDGVLVIGRRLIEQHLAVDGSEHVLAVFDQENRSITLRAFDPLAAIGAQMEVSGKAGKNGKTDGSASGE